MEDIIEFRKLKYPESQDLIKDFQFVEINNDVRIYFDVDPRGRLGFRFYITEFFTASCDYQKFNSPYDDSEFQGACLFFGQVSWDGLRHLYMGDKETDTENYLYCVSTKVIAKIFIKLGELEMLHCNLTELRR